VVDSKKSTEIGRKKEEGRKTTKNERLKTGNGTEDLSLGYWGCSRSGEQERTGLLWKGLFISRGSISAGCFCLRVVSGTHKDDESQPGDGLANRTFKTKLWIC